MTKRNAPQTTLTASGLAVLGLQQPKPRTPEKPVFRVR